MPDKKTWENRIKAATVDAGTYQPFFDDIIETLAGIMEKRDRAETQFEQTGGNAVIQYTNKSGATNLVKNPLLVMVNDLNGTALSYWRDLGLTPKGYTAMQKNGFQQSKGSFEDLLRNIGV